MSSNLPFLGGPRVHAALDWRALVDALREAFRVGANAPVRSSYPVTDAGDRLLLMPAWAAGSLGVKVVTVFPGNRARGLASVSALYLLLDGATGHPLALIDGEALTLRRTAAASALAATYLARPDSKRLLVVGTGALAPYMAAAHCAVRPMERVLVWGRSVEHARATAARLVAERPAGGGLRRSRGGARGLPTSSRCATTAREPIVRGALVQPGTHVDLVGAFTPRDARERRRPGAARRGVRRHLRRRAEGSRRPGAADQPRARSRASTSAPSLRTSSPGVTRAAARPRR